MNPPREESPPKLSDFFPLPTTVKVGVNPFRENAFTNSDGDDDIVEKLLKLHPGDISFAELKKQMQPMSHEGFEKFSTIYGMIQSEKVSISFNDVTDYNTADFEHFKRKNVRSGKPPPGSVLWANFALYLENANEPLACSKFNNIPEMISMSFVDTMPGILFGCYQLSPNECGLFLLPPDTMFGNMGELNLKIPKSATILMLLHSIRWVDAPAIERLSDEDMKDFDKATEAIENLDEWAALCFRQKSFRLAEEKYKQLLDILNVCETTDRADELRAYKRKTRYNLALIHIHRTEVDRVLALLDEVKAYGNYQEDPKHYFLMGLCHQKNYKHFEACELFAKALSYDPYNISISNAFRLSQDELPDEYKKESDFSKRMFGTRANKKYIVQFPSDFEENVTNLLRNMSLTELENFEIPHSLIPEEEEILINIVEDLKQKLKNTE